MTFYGGDFLYDFSLDARNAKNIFGGSLVVGNHDTITLYGIHPQNSLKDYSRRVTALLLKDTAELDMAIADVLSEIEHFELRAKKPTKSFWGKQLHHKEIQKEYAKILSYIDSMTVYFKLQQAQLIKEIKLLEKLSDTVVSCAKELEQCIEIGKATLMARDASTVNIRTDSLLSNTTSDTEVWYERLEKRIDDLLITHTVSLQSQAQIKMLHDNNLVILDRIASTISNTFPIWQNQMAIMLGIDLMETRMNVQDRLVGVSNKYVEQTSKKAQRKKINEIQVDKLLELNRSLSRALDEMACLEENNNVLRNEFLNTVEHTERG